MKHGVSTPNLVRIARDPKLYDEAIRKIEQSVAGYGKRTLKPA